MKVKFITVKLINGEIMDYEREYLDGLDSNEIGLFLLGLETLKRELMADFENRTPLYKTSTDPNDLEEEDGHV